MKNYKNICNTPKLRSAVSQFCFLTVLVPETVKKREKNMTNSQTLNIHSDVM